MDLSFLLIGVAILAAVGMVVVIAGVAIFLLLRKSNAKTPDVKEASDKVDTDTLPE